MLFFKLQLIAAYTHENICQYKKQEVWIIREPSHPTLEMFWTHEDLPEENYKEVQDAIKRK